MYCHLLFGHRLYANTTMKGYRKSLPLNSLLIRTPIPYSSLPRFFFIARSREVVEPSGTAGASLFSLLFNSLQFGLDFTSGTSVRLAYVDAVDIPQVNSALEANGFEDALVVTFGSERDIRIILPVDEEVAVEEQSAQAVVVGEQIGN